MLEVKIMATRKPSSKKRHPAPHHSSGVGCTCGSDCHDPHARLPGYLLIALGLMAVPLNFGVMPELSWLKAWPLLAVLFGFVVVVRATLCRRS